MTRVTVAARIVSADPAGAARLAPDIPPVLAAGAMAEVGAAAAQAAPPPPQTAQKLRRLAAIAPLNIEPYLVGAALASRADDLARAETLLTEARLRQPRSAAARYLLADTLMRENKVIGAVQEMAVVSRLLPGTAVQLVPALADYARTPGARDELAAVIRANPLLKRPLLNALAADPANADLSLALAGTDARSSDPQDKEWKTRLIRGLIDGGDYPAAYALWRRFAGVAGDTQPLLYNGTFQRGPAPPPFDWSYTTGNAGGGFAEPADGRLRVLYYGRENMALAAQTLLLAPGAYTFQAPVSGTAAEGALAWTLVCAGSSAPLMTLPVGKGDSARFTIPNGCTAQTLTLKGTASDMAQDSDLRIGPVVIARAAR
ncbi:hypothetical protein H8M03_04275 [Sphingomonas sabuli]|uniref:Tetratricopeptide repeat protein n=1 Tax=Sphingomonas sabuli TaxID=2764186 RepID=A0A7G9L4K4_9SPHN|nr:hypothetical protein [Sphingomonas sabuli]QNM83553.1 hypothetical protein H8M03_04275 [Sphingomonas sabuli]